MSVAASPPDGEGLACPASESDNGPRAGSNRYEYRECMSEQKPAGKNEPAAYASSSVRPTFAAQSGGAVSYTHLTLPTIYSV